MEGPKPLTGPMGPMIVTPGQAAAVEHVKTVHVPRAPDERPRVFRHDFIPRPNQMPPPNTSAQCELIYNTLKALLIIGHRLRTGNKPKMNEGFREIRAVNPELYDRVKTYYDRLSEQEIMFFIGPRPTHHADGSLAIWDHNRDNPVLQAVLKEEKPVDVRPGTLAQKSKLSLPRSLGGIL